MPVELVVPSVGESITEVEIGDWLKNPGEPLHQDEPVVVIETEKVTVELPAPTSGTLTTLLKHKGDKASVGDVIGYMEPDGSATAAAPTPRPSAAASSTAGAVDRPSAMRSPSAPARLHPSTPVREEQIIPMTPIRRRIAERLVEAQKSAALLTTFNEVDMSSVVALRREHQEAFQAK